jgi:hypothetical protein
MDHQMHTRTETAKDIAFGIGLYVSVMFLIHFFGAF